MQNRLLKISLTISILGIFFLLYISTVLEPSKTPIKNLASIQLNQKIKISGQITSIRKFNGFEVITLKDPGGSIDVLLDKPINLTKEQKITVIGRLSEYKNQSQVQAEKIFV